MLDQIVHERMLLGAIDSYLSSVVHVRPFLASAYRAQLEAMAERWLADNGANAVEAITAAWLSTYLASIEDRPAAETAIGDFYDWARREGLIEREQGGARGVPPL